MQTVLVCCCCHVVLQVDKSIIGWDSTIGAWSRLENHCVLGEDVQVKVRALCCCLNSASVAALLASCSAGALLPDRRTP